MERVSPVQLTLSSERSRHDCDVAKNSNADRISALLVAVVMRLACTPFCIIVERLELNICVCRHLVCKPCNNRSPVTQRVCIHSCCNCVNRERHSIWSCGRTTRDECRAGRLLAAAAVATVAAVVVVAGAAVGMCKTTWIVASLFCLPCLSPHLCLSLSPSSPWVSPTHSSWQACSAACLAARQILRRPLAVRMCGPLLTRTHHAFCHHVMCLFDTWLSLCSEFSFLCSYSSLSRPPCASTSLSSLPRSSSLTSLPGSSTSRTSCSLFTSSNFSSSCTSCFAPPLATLLFFLLLLLALHHF